MPDQICISDIPEETWRAVIAGLKSAGWSVQTGGGLDFSWAVLTRADMRIDMEFDIWAGGEIVFASIHAPAIKADLPIEALADLNV